MDQHLRLNKELARKFGTAFRKFYASASIRLKPPKVKAEAQVIKKDDDK